MNPQNSFLHTAIVPFLIGMWIFSIYLVYKKNPEIMNQEPFHKILIKQELQLESHIQSQNIRADLFEPIKDIDPGRVTHRYIEAKEELFKPVTLSSHAVELFATASSIFIKTENSLTAHSHQGELQWEFLLPSNAIFSPGPIDHAGSALILSSQNGHIYAFDMLNGQIAWYTKSPHQFFHAPIVTKSSILVFTEEKSNQLWSLKSIDKKTGEVIKSINGLELPLVGSPIALDDIVYFATQTGHLIAIDLTTGEKLWTSEASSSFKSGPAIINERIYIANEDGLVLGFDRKRGRKVAEIEMNAPIFESFKHVEGSNIAVSVDTNGSLVGIDVLKGKSAWRQNLNMSGSKHPFQIYKLSNQSLNLLTFNSAIRGYTVWTTCNSNKLCIFDAKEGRLLVRIDLKGNTKSANFVIAPESEILVVPLERAGGIKLAAFSPPTEKPSATESLPSNSSENPSPASNPEGAKTPNN